LADRRSQFASYHFWHISFQEKKRRPSVGRVDWSGDQSTTRGVGRYPADANKQDKEKFGMAKSTNYGRRTARREDSKTSWIGADGEAFGWLISERARGFAEILSAHHTSGRG
jgi:hypothetical protein